MSESGSVGFGDTTIRYTVLRSPRRKKTVEITLDAQEGVLVAAPVETPPDQIARVVRKRAAWIVARATDQVLRPGEKRLISGESLPYLGRQVRLFVEPDGSRKAQIAFSHWSFRVTVPRSLEGEERRVAASKALEAWYRHRAVERLAERVARWAPAVGCEPEKVLIRNQRQRWGSCGPDGTLRFNWRVVQLEPGLIDYVVVHELAHLFVRSHSAEFWCRVAQVMPDFRLRRQRLREAGAWLVL